jgi:hypothetical protein
MNQQPESICYEENSASFVEDSIEGKLERNEVCLIDILGYLVKMPA